MYTVSDEAVVFGERIIWKSLGRRYRDKMAEVLNTELPHLTVAPYIVAGDFVTQRGRVVFERNALYDLRFIHTLTTLLNFEAARHSENTHAS